MWTALNKASENVPEKALEPTPKPKAYPKVFHTPKTSPNTENITIKIAGRFL